MYAETLAIRCTEHHIRFLTGFYLLRIFFLINGLHDLLRTWDGFLYPIVLVLYTMMAFLLVPIYHLSFGAFTMYVDRNTLRLRLRAAH